MTTNRAKAIDKAFQSRVHLTLHYPDLDSSAKEHIWRLFVGNLSMAKTLTPTFDDETYTRLAQLPINGRQIRNVVKIAALMAAQEGSALRLDHLRTVLLATGEVEGGSLS